MRSAFFRLDRPKSRDKWLKVIYKGYIRTSDESSFISKLSLSTYLLSIIHIQSNVPSILSMYGLLNARRSAFFKYCKAISG